jgi:tissue inhibitor of metalloproteinase
LVLGLAFQAGSAAACVCVQATTIKLVDHSTDVFVAKVIDGPRPVPMGRIDDPSMPDGEVERVVYTVQVTEPLKGPVPRRAQVQILTPANEMACGYAMKPGETYLLLSKRHPDGLHTSVCRGNATGDSLPIAVLAVRRVVGDAPPRDVAAVEPQ